MRFISLTIKQDLFQDRFEFSTGANIVHSNKNSVGKTTLLRFLMFSLGYPIPGTRGMNFARYDLDAEIVNAKNEVCHILRTGDYITLICNSEEHSYSLPSDLNTLHMQVFGIQNDDVIENLLGAYYIDQEKGWTLLNRGKAIGSIHFSIEGLIRGLSNRSDNDLAARLSATKRELQKYRHMLDIAQYQAELNELGETVVYDAPLDEIERALDILYSERKPVADELERLKKVIRQNTSFKNFISSYHLRVVSSKGEEIPVNENTIVGYKDDIEYLITKRKMIEARIVAIDRKIATLNREHEKEDTLVTLQTSIQRFDADVSKMQIDAITTERIIRRLDNERKVLEDLITESVKINNPIVAELHNLISCYANELGVDEKYVRPSKDYIFTSDLKSLTGAIFHKIVFAFKLSYIKLIDTYTGTKLPIILDSPSGRELDKVNISETMSILSRDFT